MTIEANQIPGKDKIMQRPELFLLSKEILLSCIDDEDAFFRTFEDMEKIGIAKMPYPLIDIGIAGHIERFHKDGEKEDDDKFLLTTVLDLEPGFEQNCEVRFRFRDDKSHMIVFKFDDHVKIDKDGVLVDKKLKKIETSWHDVHLLLGNRHEKYEGAADMCRRYRVQAEVCRKILIVMLATRNVVKTRIKDKLAALGIGKAKKDDKRPIYTTTLSLPVRHVSAPGPGHSGLGVTKRPHLRRGHVRQQHCGPRYEFVKQVWVEPCFVNADENFVSSRSSYNTSMRDVHAHPPPRSL